MLDNYSDTGITTVLGSVLLCLLTTAICTFGGKERETRNRRERIRIRCLVLQQINPGQQQEIAVHEFL